MKVGFSWKTNCIRPDRLNERNMMPYVNARTLAASAMLLLAGTPRAALAQAQQLPPSASVGDVVTVGAGLALVPDYEGAKHYQLVPAPAAAGSIGGHSFLLAGNQLSVDALRERPGPVWNVQAGPVVQVNFNRSAVSLIDDKRVKALGSVGTAVELGGYVGVAKTGVVTSAFDQFSATLSYRHDVAGVHDAGIWQPSLTYFTPLSIRSAVALTASAEIVENAYARTYYSVSSQGSATSGLPVYAAKGGLKSWTLGLIATRSVKGTLLHGVQVVGAGSYGRVTGSIGDSPLVARAGSRDQWLAAVGLAYSF